MVPKHTLRKSATMSFAMSMNATTIRPGIKLQASQTSRPRLGRSHLQVHAVTNWMISPEPKWANTNGDKARKLGQSFDLTEAVAEKATAKVQSGGGGDFDLKGLEEAGLNLEFRSEGTSQNADSPADLYLKDLGSKVEIALDGEPLEKNKEYKLGIGQTLKIGDDAVFQVLRDSRAHA